jgi:hypothetical protein
MQAILEKIAPRVRSMQVAGQPSVIFSGPDLSTGSRTVDLETIERSLS